MWSSDLKKKNYLTPSSNYFVGKTAFEYNQAIIIYKLIGK